MIFSLTNEDRPFIINRNMHEIGIKICFPVMLDTGRATGIDLNNGR